MTSPIGRTKGLVPPKGTLVSQCKGCNEPIRNTQDRIWATTPIGLVHTLCAALYNLPTSGEPTPGIKK